jgi:predicted CopG family antitoxin
MAKPIMLSDSVYAKLDELRRPHESFRSLIERLIKENGGHAGNMTESTPASLEREAYGTG